MIDVNKITFLYSCPHLSQMKDFGDEVAFFGRSNVGKSSLINSITKKQIAKTSKTPGRTKHAVVYELILKKDNFEKKIFLVDLPGFGFALMSKEQAKEIEKLVFSYLEFRPNLKVIFLLIDTRRTPNEMEFKLIDICKQRNIKVFVVLTKYDKLPKSKLKPAVKAFTELTKIDKEDILIHSTYFEESSEIIREKIINC